MIRVSAALALVLLLAGCAGEDGRPGPVTSMFCGMRENGCAQRCK